MSPLHGLLCMKGPATTWEPLHGVSSGGALCMPALASSVSHSEYLLVGFLHEPRSPGHSSLSLRFSAWHCCKLDLMREMNLVAGWPVRQFIKTFRLVTLGIEGSPVVVSQSVPLLQLTLVSNDQRTAELPRSRKSGGPVIVPINRFLHQCFWLV